MNNTVLDGAGLLLPSFLATRLKTSRVPSNFLLPLPAVALKLDRDEACPAESVSQTKGQATIEFLWVGLLVACLFFCSVQLLVVLLKTDQVALSAFWAARASCVRGDGCRAGKRIFGQEPLAAQLTVQANNGTARTRYLVEKGAFPALETVWTSRKESSLLLEGQCALFPEPPGDDGDN